MASIGGSRTLKLTILGDVDNLRKSLSTGSNEVEGFAGKLEKFGKMAAVAFAAAAVAAGAYAIKIGIDGVKAAIADEAAQVKLASALKNATGATEDQIAAVEKSILKMELATGVSDDKLRPAFARLSLSTNDVKKSQELLALALDISTQSGKPLEGVANALGKAYDGNTAALGKLGIGLSSAELKAMSFTDVQSKLNDLFGGAAAANAQTYQGRIDRLKVTFDETKETIGNALLPVLDKFIKFITDTIIPNVGKFIALFDPLKKAIMDNKETFEAFGAFLSKYIIPVLVDGFGAAIGFVAKIAGGVVDIIAGVIRTIEKLVSGSISGINAIIRAYNAIPILPDIPQITAPTFTSPKVTAPTVNIPTAPTFTEPSVSSGSTSASAGVKSATSAFANAPDLAATRASNSDMVQSAIAAAQIAVALRPPINLTVNGAIDSESASRQIIELLNNSYYRGTGGAGALVG